MLCDVLIADEKYEGLNPISFGYEDCAPSHRFGPAIRDYWLLHYVVTGTGIYRIGGKTYTVRPGDLFVIPPLAETYYEADAKNPWHYIWIGFTANALPVKLLPVMHCPEALSVFTAMKKCEQQEYGQSAFLCARLWDLMALLLQHKKPELDYVERALGCIHAEYMHPITVEQIAARLNLDRSYFSTLFKKKMGVSPGQYLLRHRMNSAASLLQDGTKSISVVANSVGYGDIFNFSKMFKRCFGIPPREYMKQTQGEH